MNSIKTCIILFFSTKFCSCQNKQLLFWHFTAVNHISHLAFIAIFYFLLCSLLLDHICAICFVHLKVWLDHSVLTLDLHHHVATVTRNFWLEIEPEHSCACPAFSHHCCIFDLHIHMLTVWFPESVLSCLEYFWTFAALFTCWHCYTWTCWSLSYRTELF